MAADLQTVSAAGRESETPATGPNACCLASHRVGRDGGCTHTASAPHGRWSSHRGAPLEAELRSGLPRQRRRENVRDTRGPQSSRPGRGHRERDRAAALPDSARSAGGPAAEGAAESWLSHQRSLNSLGAFRPLRTRANDSGPPYGRGARSTGR